MKTLTSLIFIALVSFNSAMALAADAPKGDTKTAAQIAEEKRCTVPAFAKAIGHEELWKKHNGCAPSKVKNDE